MYAHFIQKDFPDTVIDFNGAGDLKNTPPIIAGNNNSVMVGGADTRTLALAGLTPGSEGRSFSIESWIAPLTSAEVYAFNHTNASIKWAAGIHFTVMVNGTPATITYNPEVMKAFHVVGVYSRYSMALYVDGVMVGTTAFDTPNTSGWVSDADVTIGGTGRAVVDGVAFYRRELQAQTVQSHYLLGTTIPAITTNLSALSSTIFNFENQTEHLIIKEVWPDWEPGTGTGIEIIDNTVYSEAGGSWQTFIPLTDYQVLQRGQIAWRAEGTVTVEISKDDGVTWTAANNYSYIPGITGSSPMTLDVRVTLGALSTLSYLEVELYDSLSYETQLDDGTAGYSGGNIVNAADRFNQLEYRHDRGVRLDGTEDFVIVPDPGGDPIHAIDMWFRPEEMFGTLFWTDGGGGAGLDVGEPGHRLESLFVNGNPSGSYEVGEWVHVLIVLGTPSDTTFWIGNSFTGSIGSATFYRQPVTGQEERIYRSYFGGQKAEVAEPQSIVIAESAEAWDLYSYTWTNVGS